MDDDGSLYIGDGDNHRVRKVSPDGMITTIAGTGIAGNAGDGGPATAAQLKLAEEEVKKYPLPAIPGKKQKFPAVGKGTKPVR